MKYKFDEENLHILLKNTLTKYKKEDFNQNFAYFEITKYMMNKRLASVNNNYSIKEILCQLTNFVKKLTNKTLSKSLSTTPYKGVDKLTKYESDVFSTDKESDKVGGIEKWF